ncbi:hypothetical protein NQD34_012775 [Periophthalmus magnuspinnatus]|nr:hypothetical protein NQD34_012775 [Periophthalmus magnuspinnatus]
MSFCSCCAYISLKTNIYKYTNFIYYILYIIIDYWHDPLGLYTRIRCRLIYLFVISCIFLFIKRKPKDASSTKEHKLARGRLRIRLFNEYCGDNYSFSGKVSGFKKSADTLC